MTSLCLSWLCTGGFYCLVNYFFMTNCSDYNIFKFLIIHFGFIVVILTTFLAMPVLNVSVLYTSGFFCFYKCHFMTGCRKSLTIAYSTSVAPEEFYSILCTCSFFSDSSFVPVMSQCRDYTLLFQHCITYRTMASHCLPGFRTGCSYCHIRYHCMTFRLNYNVFDLPRIFRIICKIPVTSFTMPVLNISIFRTGHGFRIYMFQIMT